MILYHIIDGVRAGAKKIGLNTEKYDAPPPTKRDVMNPRYPLTVPYEMEQVLIDLIEFASKYLVIGGRLVYWLPTNSEELVIIIEYNIINNNQLI